MGRCGVWVELWERVGYGWGCVGVMGVGGCGGVGKGVGVDCQCVVLYVVLIIIRFKHLQTIFPR